MEVASILIVALNRGEGNWNVQLLGSVMGREFGRHAAWASPLAMGLNGGGEGCVGSLQRVLIEMDAVGS